MGRAGRRRGVFGKGRGFVYWNEQSRKGDTKNEIFLNGPMSIALNSISQELVEQVGLIGMNIAMTSRKSI